MPSLAYTLAGVHVALFLVFAMRQGSYRDKGRKQLTMALIALFTLAYFIVAASLAGLIVPLIILEAVGLMRFVFHDFHISLGTGDSRPIQRHTEGVLRKSITASVFTNLVTAGLLALFGPGNMAVTALYAWPAFFALEYGLRLLRSSRIKAELAAMQRRNQGR